MNKAKLVELVAKKCRKPKSHILSITDTIIDSIESTLRKGERVQLAGFGRWEKKRRAPRPGRNPQTGASLTIPARNVVTFQAGERLIGLIN